MNAFSADPATGGLTLSLSKMGEGKGRNEENEHALLG